MLRAYFSLGLVLAAPACASASDSADPPAAGTTTQEADDCCPTIDAGSDSTDDEVESGGASSVGAASAGCSELLWREAAATAAAAKTLVATATELTQRVSVACGSLHEELTYNSEGTPASTATVTDLCAAAAQAIEELGGTTPEVAVEGDLCTITATDQIGCEESCSGAEGCSGDAANARCDPKSQYSVCEGSCSGDAICHGSIQAPAQCVGQCKGTCEGTCAGTCTSLTGSANAPASDSDSCGGFCEGSCDGTCTGECLLDSGASFNCGDEVPCQGACSESSDALQCFWPLSEVATECLPHICYQACAGSVALAPVCVPPTVHVMGGFTANVVTALEAYLAPLLQAAGGDGRLAARVAPGLVEAAGDVQLALEADPSCMAEVGVENIGALVDVAAARSAVEAAVEAASLVVEGALGAEQSNRIL